MEERERERLNAAKAITAALSRKLKCGVYYHHALSFDPNAVGGYKFDVLKVGNAEAGPIDAMIGGLRLAIEAAGWVMLGVQEKSTNNGVHRVRLSVRPPDGSIPK